MGSQEPSGQRYVPKGANPEPGVGELVSQASQQMSELREDITRTRQELGDTVEALAAKMDLKTRLRRRGERTVRDLSAEAGRRVHAARATGQRLGARARTTVTSREVAGRRRAAAGTAIAVTVAVAAAGAAWAMRRRRARARERWLRAVRSRDTDTILDLAAGTGREAMTVARDVAASGQARARAQGAAAVAGVVVTIAWLRRRRVRRARRGRR